MSAAGVPCGAAIPTLRIEKHFNECSRRHAEEGHMAGLTNGVALAPDSAATPSTKRDTAVSAAGATLKRGTWPA